MVYYSLMHGHGRDILAEILGAADPFGLEPRRIVERAVALGHTPGTAHEVTHDGRTYLVTIGRDAEQILVQEVREEPYEGE